jgi:hypothetical protein
VSGLARRKNNNGGGKPLHPIFESCTWRFDPPEIPEDEKLQKCAECYSKNYTTTDYCEHMRKFYWDDGR